MTPPAPAPEAPPAQHKPVYDANNPIVEVRDLKHYFGEGENRKLTLDITTLKLVPGEVVFLIGPSGHGKTTLLTLIGGIRTMQEGSIRVMGRELLGLKSQQLTELRRDIGFIFQAHNLFDALTALQNVRMAMELEHPPSAAMDQRAVDILGRLGLGHRTRYKPHTMSGGQKQRVAIARALVNRPQLILADEPTAALDRASGREVILMLKELARDEGCTVLLVTHDEKLFAYADRIVNISEGRISSVIEVEETVTIIEFLVKCPLFAHETPAGLTEISQKMVKERYTPETTILRQGEEGDKFYLVREGEVKVARTEESGAVTTKVLKEGDVFGEVALLTGNPRNATITTDRGVLLYSLKKGDFSAALNTCPSFKEQLLRVFAERR